MEMEMRLWVWTKSGGAIPVWLVANRTWCLLLCLWMRLCSVLVWLGHRQWRLSLFLMVVVAAAAAVLHLRRLRRWIQMRLYRMM